MPWGPSGIFVGPLSREIIRPLKRGGKRLAPFGSQIFGLGIFWPNTNFVRGFEIHGLIALGWPKRRTCMRVSKKGLLRHRLRLVRVSELTWNHIEAFSLIAG